MAPWPQQPEPSCAAPCLSPSSGFIRPFLRALRTSAAVATPAPGAPLFALPAASIPLRSALNTMPLVQGGLVLGSPPLAPPPSGSKAPRTGRTPQHCPAIDSKHNHRNAGRPVHIPVCDRLRVLARDRLCNRLAQPLWLLLVCFRRVVEDLAADHRGCQCLVCDSSTIASLAIFARACELVGTVTCLFLEPPSYIQS